MSSTMRILQQAARRLFRARTFAIAATLTFALGTGGVATVFTVIDAVLLRPLPYPHADQLVDLSHTLQIPALLNVDQSDATFLGYRQHNTAFTDIAAWRATSVNLALGRAGNAPSALRAPAAIATGSLFNVLRVAAVRGRTLKDDDGTPGAPPVAMIGSRLWKGRFNGDPAVVGQPLLVDGIVRTIVGVLPPSFAFPSAETDIWLPLTLDPAHVQSAAFDYRGIARLRPGVTPEIAAADLQRVLPSVPEEYPGRLAAASITALHMRAIVRPFRDVVLGDAPHVLWIVFAAVGVLLLISCANVANLFIARAEGRRREFALRRALGAGQRTLLVEFLSESALLMGTGGALGLGFAMAGVAILRSMQASAGIPRLSEVQISGAAIGVLAGVTALTALFVSTLSAISARGSSLSALLTGSTRSATASLSHLRGRRTLVIGQIALALILLIAAGLLVRSFIRLRQVEPGFVAANALTLRLTLPEPSYPTSSDAARLLVRSVEHIAAIPGVQGVGITTQLPLSEQGHQDSAVFIEDHPPVAQGMADGVPDLHPIVFATPGYFRAMGIPLVAGRLLAPVDPGGNPSASAPEVLVSASFARHYWSGNDAIGKRVRMNPTDPWSTIVGIVGGVRDVALSAPPSEVVYSALVTMSAAGAPWTPRSVAFAVRTSGDPAAVTVAVARAIRALDPALPVYDVTPLHVLLAESTARASFVLFVLAITAVLALAIGSVGIYGVIAYFVTLRTRELGVRLALGAQPRRVQRLVARQAIADAMVGIALGLAVAIAVTRVMTAMLFEMSPVDLPTFAAAAVVLMLIALAASWVPARRAAALDPASALRAE